MSVIWGDRLQDAGASARELASIQAAYDDSRFEVQQSIDALVAGIDDAGLRTMLSTWRAGNGPFAAGMPGGGLPFGSHAAILTGDSADDGLAISAGTGQKLSIAPVNIDGGAAS